MGNSGYGKTITNQLKHKNVEYCSDAEARRKVNTPLFRKLDNITEETVGFFVYQYAKLACYNFIMIS